MTVIVERTDCKGDIKHFEHIKAINDKGSHYELVVSENWQTIVSKRNNIIIGISAN